MKNWSLPLVSMLFASVALAEPPAPATQKKAAALVNAELVQPLKKAESKWKRFSRAARPPLARRVRVLDAVATTDARGRSFVRFAIDARVKHDEAEWETDVLVGCAYLKEREVFVQQGESYVPASSTIGGDDAPHAHACRPADEASEIEHASKS